MIKDFQLQTINDIPVEITPIPGINSLQLNYEASIGGANAPEPGADKTSENVAASILNQGTLATKSDISAAEIADRTITSVKLALLTVSADVIAAGAITESKLYTGAVTADKIAANTITAAKIAANTITANEIAASTITAAKMNVSQLSAITANIGDITAGSITGVTITGGTIQTSSSDNTGVKMTTSGFAAYGEAMSFYNTSGNLKGYLGASTSEFYMVGVTNQNVKIGSFQDIYLDAAAGFSVTPVRNNVDLGNSNYFWRNVHANRYTFANISYYLERSGAALVFTGMNRLTMDGGTFRRVGFTFKDSAGNNKYIEVLATADPV